MSDLGTIIGRVLFRGVKCKYSWEVLQEGPKFYFRHEPIKKLSYAINV